MYMNLLPTGTRRKKQPRSKRTLIGKVDPKTGDVVPTDGRCKHLSTEGKKQAKQKKEQEETKQKVIRTEEDNKLIASTRRTFCGAKYLLDAIAKKRAESRLKALFP